MVMPSHPDQNNNDTVVKTPVTWRTKAVIAATVVMLIALIALHLAGVFGP
jgi:hypothetical protein